MNTQLRSEGDLPLWADERLSLDRVNLRARGELRDLAATDTAVQLGIDPRMRELADLPQEVADFTLTLGSGGQLRALNTRVQTLTVALKKNTIDTIPLDMASLEEAKRTITRAFRKRTELAAPAEQAVMSGSVEQVQAKCGEIGRRLMRLSFYNLDALQPGFSQRLRAIGASMRLLEVERIYMDGSDSLRKRVDGVQACQRAFEGLIVDISGASSP